MITKQKIVMTLTIKNILFMNSFAVKIFRNSVLLLLCCILNSANIIGQEEAAVKVLARSSSNSIKLRWAANTPLAWKKGNDYGYLIERYTISRNGAAVLPIESTMVTSFPLRPKPLAEWETIATSDDNAAVMAQAIYGDDFDVNAGGGMGQILAVNDQLEQRFTFALMAAEQNFDASIMAGWAYIDTDVKPGEKYLYKIKLALPENSGFEVEEGSVYSSPDFEQELPKPLGFTGIFADRNVLLNWNFNLLKQTYSSYILEKSTDGTSFKKVNGQPIFNAEDIKEGKQVSLSYNDSISNGKKYYYRIKGLTPFGETGPPSATESGMGTASLAFTPHIKRKRLPTDTTVELEWEFDEEGNSIISGFELKKASKAEGPYKTVQDNIAPTARKTTYNKLDRINYFTIVAIGKNGTEKPSFPAIVQPVDSIPPTPPIELLGTIDTTGIVKLSWKANEEPDLSGYRIFRANNPKTEFLQITLEPTRGNSYQDTVKIKNLNQNIYYKILAVDQRYNESDLSKILILEKPDVTPPSSPVFKDYSSSEEGIKINWIPSTSEDVTSHSLYRKSISNNQDMWELLVEIPMTTNTTSYIDNTVEAGKSYAYTLVAKDETGLESISTEQLTIKAPKKLFAELITRFNGSVDRENRRIRLTWKTTEENISEFLIYRAEEGAPLSLYKTIDGDLRSFMDTSLTVSTQYSYALQLVKKDGTQSQLKQIKLTY